MEFWFKRIILLVSLYFSRCHGELIKALPGQPSNILFHQYSGYIVTNAEHGGSLFYYFVEADSPNHLTLPLTLWLNGGPGCSSLGLGAFMETGKSGDQDSKIPMTQTRMIANSIATKLNLSTTTKYGPWYHKKQVGGWTQTYGAQKEGENVTILTYATVRGAAHEVPFTSPSQALTLFHHFLNGTSLPRPKHY